MVIHLNKSKFMTKIGVMYYLWRYAGSRAAVSYLGVGKENFLRYIRKIENKSVNQDKFLLTDKKSADIEKKILEYLDGKIKSLDLKIAFLSGTEFQKRVWKSAAAVPYGKTVSYKELAYISGYSKAWRAVGSALKNNPIILIVPCHRVIKQNGKISDFISGKKTKEFLLDLEN